MNHDQDLSGFCAAPWAEGVLYNNGILRTCCRNGTVFGNWITDGLRESWQSKLFRDFRYIIAKGDFPDDSCRNCYLNGTARSLVSELISPFKQNIYTIFNFLKKTIPEITAIESQFVLRKENEYTEKILHQYFLSIDNLEKYSLQYPPEIKLALVKLIVIGKITKAFLEKDLVPSPVAPFRQVQLIAKCNARCIQCPGRYTGEIFNGPSLDEKYIDMAFSFTEDIIDFYMNGSEFLFYPGWKKIADYLVKNGVKLSISSNGILLTHSNIRYLIDNKIIQKLNISIDGATKNTVESIRMNVNYDKLIQNIAYIFSYATQKKYDFDLSISFVLMKRNYYEFPDIVRLVHNLRDGNKLPSVNIYCQGLENYMIQGYRDLIRGEHHTLVEKKELIDIFKKVSKEAENTNIPVSVFYSHKIVDFIHQDCPFPSLPKNI